VLENVVGAGDEAVERATGALLSALRARDVTFWLEGDHLRLSAPKDAMTEELQAELRRRKGEIVAYLRGAEADAGPSALRRAPRGAATALSFAQERMWFLQKLDPASVAYNLQANVALPGRLDLRALDRCLGELVRRHEVLRTVFTERDGRPVQVVAPPSAVSVPLSDLTSLPPPERVREAERLATEEVRRPFDLERGPVLRVRVLRLGEVEHQLLVTQHHIVTDGWSIAVLVEEVLALYLAFAAGEASPLPEPSFQYADFAHGQREWLQGEVLERRLGYWRQRLAGAPPALELPTDRPRPAVQTYNGATLHFDLPEDLSRLVHALSRAEGVTPFMTLLAASQVVLARYADQDDVVLGTANGSRPLVETERMLGLFVNTLVLRTDLSGDPTFRELLSRVRRVTLEAFAHGDLPFERLVEELRPRRDLARSPIFQVLFVIQNTPLEAVVGRSPAAPGVIGERGTAAYELSFYLIDTGRAFRGSLEYNTDLFDEATAVRLVEHYRAALEAAVAHPERRLSALPLLEGAERRKVLGEWNATERAVPPARVHELFSAQAAARPEAVAVVAGDGSLTYGELERRSNCLARRLRRLGVRPGALAAIHVERSLDMMVGLLGILKAGGAYVPLDPTYPAERLTSMLEDAAPAVVLSERGRAGDLPVGKGPVLRVEDALDESDAPLESDAGPEDLAYVIFTSGSTGRPKGVQVPHRALTNLLASMREKPGLSERDVLLAVTTIAFDIAGLELFLPLVTGARVVLASRPAAADPSALAALLADTGTTVMQATPATWRMLVDSGWAGTPGLKALCGGEALPLELARALRSRCGELWNVYGPTETTIWSTAERVEEAGATVPIGRPLANTRLYVLDRGGQPVPLGAVGELFIGGWGVARGYLNQPELTAERFVPDPFAREPGARLYRTGDLARRRVDGRVECLGRADHQLKLRGFRIEPGEIEAVLREHPGVSDCVVVAHEEGADKRLVAYVAVRDEAPPSAAELRGLLQRRLPAYMMPSAFVRLAALPRTPNGKVDRRALPAPGPASAETEGGDVPPRSPIEEAVAGIWRDVLGREGIGAHASFFDLGGHSLTGTQVLARIQAAFGVQIPLRRLFESSTVAGLAEAVEAARQAGRAPEAPALVAVRRDQELPLSFAQERLWFLHQLEDASAAYHIPGALYLRGRLDETSLERSLAEIWRRHESLRTTFENVDGRPRQRIGPPESFALARHDLSAIAAGEREAQARRLAMEEAQRPFDLARGPLLRCALVPLGEEEHLLLVTLHHVVADGWSLGVLVRELGILYRAFLNGEPSPLPELTVQYADFAQWQRRWLSGPELGRQLRYWGRQLEGVSVLDLPGDRPRPRLQTFHGAQQHFMIGPEIADGVRRLARSEKATAFMVLVAAFQALLQRYTGQDDIAVGTPIAGRGRAELEGLVGLFANTLVLRTDFGGDPSFREALARVREVALDAYAHQDTPFEKLVEEVRPERNLSTSPLFQVMFVLQNAPAAPLELPGLNVRPFGLDPGTSRFDLTLFVTETAGGFFATAEYNTDLFDPDRMARLASHYQSLLGGAVASPARRLSELPMLGAAERQTVLEAWNDSPREVGAACVHERFAAQAARTPAAVAVAFEGDKLTYGALDARANRLAHRLRQMGVGPEVLVGIAVERSLDMFVALMGVLKAGGAYLPLDPAYPQERLAYMLEDAQARVLLTQEALRASLPPTTAEVVCLDSVDLAGESEEAPTVAVDGEGLAYLIYTSGSTGRPKGVQIPHRALSSFLAAMAERPGLEPTDVLLSVTTLSFDIAGLELYLPLVTGARVELASRETAADGVRLLERLNDSGATVMQATPATWRLLLEAGWAGGPLKVLCGGEALPGDLGEELRSRGSSLWNLYGPTETTIWSTVHRVEQTEAVSPLGRPVANTRIYVLDSSGGPAPIGVPGELCIGGAGVARGYRNRPDLSAERFVPDPFGGEPGSRLYRTGDVARYRANGVIEFLGRSDHQVKVRGFRIEPGEIESALLEMNTIRAAAVLPRPNGAGDAQLVAHVVLAPGLEPTVTELRATLRGKLPPHMVPSSFVILDDLPLTPNGKVDRRALARLDASQSEGRPGHVEPRTPMERLVADVWKEALGVVRVSVHDNFFDLGGHSLLSMRVLARVEKAVGKRVNPRELIFQTLEQFAAQCEKAAGPLSREDASPA
jgi:amino acid adenylation domain-containing protein